MKEFFSFLSKALAVMILMPIIWLVRGLIYLEEGIDLSIRMYIPNILTLARLVLSPFVAVGYIYGVLTPDLAWAWCAISFYIIISMFDLFDGYLSRRWRVETDFGAKWDPIADKVLILPLLPALWFAGILGPWLVVPSIIIGLREPGIDLLRRWCTKTKFPSSPMAKLKTGLQMISLGVLMSSHSLLIEPLWFIGAILFWVASILSLATGLDYVARVWPWLDWLIGQSLKRFGVRPQL